MLLLVLSTAAFHGPALPHHAVGRAARPSGRLVMVAETDVGTQQTSKADLSLAQELASVTAVRASAEAASTLAAQLAPLQLDSPAKQRRKRDVIRTFGRRLRAVFGFQKAVRDGAMELIEAECELPGDESEPEPMCTDESKLKEAAGIVSGAMGRAVRFALGRSSSKEEGDELAGDAMEAGWESKAQGSALKRTLEVWGFLAKSALRVVKAGKSKGKTEEEVSAAKTEAAEFIRDGLFNLGPTFVKLGQVVSTRTDVLEKEYIAVLRDLQDNVPGFGGDKAVAIIEEEFGQPISEVFDSFDRKPIAAASLGQVHRAVYKGTPVAVKVQRAGLKELFDTDLKNLKVLVKLLDSFDPKSDGADRSYSDIYDESSKLLYEEIDYTLEGKNCVRFAQEFDSIGMGEIRVPKVFWDVTTPRVLTMEFIESFKLTDIARVEAAGLDRKGLAQKTADSFLAQILKTSYFHCDPHPGNLCVDRSGNLVYYDCGMMNELSPTVAKGFKEACFAVFGGGPFISQIQLDAAGKRLVDALELMGVLAKGADRLSVEKLARYFIRSFKNVQQGKTAGDIKTTLGADLQALTDQQVFRFPSTFTFIFRAFASIDGIGKGLDPDFDLPKLAQPFINELTEADAGSSVEKWASRFASATGLNAADLDIAITQPKKVAYLEQTVRAMEQGSLKIRVRSLENERALSRLALSQEITNKLLLCGLLLNLGLARATALPATAWFVGAGAVGAGAGASALAVKLFDKKNAKYEAKDFGDEA